MFPFFWGLLFLVHFYGFNICLGKQTSGKMFNVVRIYNENYICPHSPPPFRANMKSIWGYLVRNIQEMDMCVYIYSLHRISFHCILKKTSGSLLCPHLVTSLWAFKSTHSAREPDCLLPLEGTHICGRWHQIFLVSRTRGRQ